MEVQYKEYSNTDKHNNTVKDNRDYMVETYSKEIEQGKRKLKITLEFPRAVDPKDAERFEKNLRQIYISKIQTGSLQTTYKALSSTPLNGKSELMSQGGKSNE